jgi:hypothetical protein
MGGKKMLEESESEVEFWIQKKNKIDDCKLAFLFAIFTNTAANYNQIPGPLSLSFVSLAILYYLLSYIKVHFKKKVNWNS